MAEETKRTAVIQSAPIALELSQAAIEVTKQNIKLCEQLVREVLERDIDYGRIPGVPRDFLWDSGAAKIMAAFNCYPEYKVIDATIQVPHIRYTIACYLINRKTQQVVATGIGAAYTKEVKHRYRWVDDPENEGISPKGLKRNRDGKYRVPNPDTEDLLNTIAKMAAKRADVDATQSLPGVAATLRKLFLGKSTGPQEQRSAKRSPSKTQAQAEPGSEEKPTWRWFAAKLQTLGVTQGQARYILGVNSIKDDWVNLQHRTLDEAYDIIKAAVAPELLPEEHRNTKADVVIDRETGEIVTGEEELFGEAEPGDTSETGETQAGPGPAHPNRPPSPAKPKRDPNSIKSINALLRVCYDDWDMQPAEVYKELNVTSASQITETPPACYVRIAAARDGESGKDR